MQDTMMKDFPGGPDVEMPCFQCRGPGFDSWSGTVVPYAASAAKNKKRDTIVTFKIPTVD